MKSTVIRSCLLISLISPSLKAMKAEIRDVDGSLLAEESGEIQMNLISLFLHDHEQYKTKMAQLPISVLVPLKRYIMQKNLLVKTLKYALAKSCVLKLVGHTAPVKSAFGKTGMILVTCSDDGSAKLWDVKSCTCLATFLHINSKNALLNDAEDKLVTYCDRFVQIWDIKSQALLAVLQGHNGKISQAQFNYETDSLVTASEDGTAKVWESNNGECLLTINVGEPLTSAEFDLKGKRVVTISKDKKVNVWDAQTGKLWFTLAEKYFFFFSTPATPIREVAFGDHDLLATSHEDGTVRIWNLAKGKLLRFFSPPNDEKVLTRYIRNNKDKGICVRSEGKAALAIRFNKAGTKIEIEHDGGARIWGILSGLLFETIDEFSASTFNKIMMINKNPDSEDIIDRIAHTVYNHVTGSKRYSVEFLKSDDRIEESTADGTLYVCNVSRVKHLFDWFDNECSFEQALLFDCCFETEIIRRLFAQHDEDALTFELDHFPWLQKYIDSMPLEIQNVLSRYLNKTAKTADGLGACTIV